MVGPDSQLQGEGEVLHWLVANIPGNKVEDGQTLAPYLQPHPPFGTGYHRCELQLFPASGTKCTPCPGLACLCRSSVGTIGELTLLRFVFLLYKQEGKVEMEPELRKDPLNLKDRNFSSLDFYSAFQVFS